jgi:tetratricopeptide (TPR) repeat protein
MKEKIEWYQEILQIDPGSKVFFPLARLLSQSDQAGQAVDVLRAGLACHPEHAEARLLLVQLLRQAGDKAACAQEFAHISAMFSAYPDFWQTWSENAPNAEIALALLFLAATLRRPGLSLQDILHDGLKHQGATPDCETEAPLAEPGAAPPAPPEPARAGREPRGNAGRGKASSLRTKTMAEVLVAQGDREGALAIYRELLAEAAGTGAEKRLRERIAELTRDVGPNPPPNKSPEKLPDKSAAAPLSEPGGSMRAAQTPLAAPAGQGSDTPETEKNEARAGEAAGGQPDPGREKMRAMMESLAHRLEERAQA